jgi:hypothetical protein
MHPLPGIGPVPGSEWASSTAATRASLVVANAADMVGSQVRTFAEHALLQVECQAVGGKEGKEHPQVFPVLLTAIAGVSAGLVASPNLGPYLYFKC